MVAHDRSKSRTHLFPLAALCVSGLWERVSLHDKLSKCMGNTGVISVGHLITLTNMQQHEIPLRPSQICC